MERDPGWLGRGLRLPLIVAPMFLISSPALVLASARAGVIGALPLTNARTLDDLETWLNDIRRELAAIGRSEQWIANIIVHPSYHRFDAELDLIAAFRPRIVVTALGNPARVIERVHEYGGRVLADVVTTRHARKAIDAGADGLVLVAAGAGGHTGVYSPFAFVEEVRRFWPGPLVLGGAISSGTALRAALVLGADLAYMGTRFIVARESFASDGYRSMLTRVTLADIVTSAAVTGVSANWIAESVRIAGFDEEALRSHAQIDFSNAADHGKAWKDIWSAGHGVGNVREADRLEAIVDALAAEFAASGDISLSRLGPWEVNRAEAVSWTHRAT